MKLNDSLNSRRIEEGSTPSLFTWRTKIKLLKLQTITIMKNVSNKLVSLRNRIEKTQEELDDLKMSLEIKRDELEEEDVVKNESKVEEINNDLDYIEDVYYALDRVISEIENFIEE